MTPNEREREVISGVNAHSLFSGMEVGQRRHEFVCIQHDEHRDGYGGYILNYYVLQRITDGKFFETDLSGFGDSRLKEVKPRAVEITVYGWNEDD